jgi:hypothetical protein
MHSEGVDLEITSEKSSDGSAKSFTRPTYSVSRKARKSALIMKGTLWKNNMNILKDVPTIVNCNYRL